MKLNNRFAVIGCGNMAQALVIPMKGMAKFYTYTPSGIRASFLANEVGGTQCTNLVTIPKCDFYMIGCKPQQFEQLAFELKKTIPKDATVISLMAGITISKIQDLLGTDSVIRTMPNTPAVVGEGVIALHSSIKVTSEVKEIVIKFFETGSKVFTFEEESLIDTITPFSGSGPAYLFELARIFSEKMQSMGVKREVAEEMIAGTFMGASQMMVASEKSFEQLRTDVTSKNGVTFEALKVFEDSGLTSIAETAIDAAFKRAKELSR